MASAMASTSALPLDAMPATERQLILHAEYAVRADTKAEPKRATLLSTRLQELLSTERSSKPTGPPKTIVQVYVHWAGTDPRLDCWVDEILVGEPWTAANEEPTLARPATPPKAEVTTRQKRKARETSSPVHKLSATGVGTPNVSLQPRAITSVIFGWHEIKTWYDSPYQLEEVHTDRPSNALQHTALHTSVNRASSAPPAAASRPTSTSSQRAAKKPRLSGTPVAEPAVEVKTSSSQPRMVPVVDIPAPSSARSKRSSPRAKSTEHLALPEPKQGSPSEASIDESQAVAHALLPAGSETATNVSAPPSQLSLATGGTMGVSPSPPTSPETTVPPLPSRPSSLASLPQPLVLIDVPLAPSSSKPSSPTRGTAGRFLKSAQPTQKALRASTAPSRPRSSLTAGKPSREASPAIPVPTMTTGAGKGKTSPRTTLAHQQPRAAQKDVQLVPATGTVQLKEGRIYVCDGCFKYFAFAASFDVHRKGCKVRYPPGRRVWQRGSQTIWEVDGAQAKLWCQNLSLFGKLFIDHKYVFFDVEGFLFYILCEGDGQRDYMLGFFSKEKVSYDDYNLACICLLPPYQRRGYGVLLIELSYALHARTSRARRLGIAGTPERPLSDLGLRGYLAHWTSVIVRYLRRVVAFGSVEAVREVEEAEREAVERAAKEAAARKAKRLKGWVDTLPPSTSAAVPSTMTTTIATTSKKPIKTEGGGGGALTVEISIVELARATRLRVDDVILALSSSGLLALDMGSDAAKLVVTAEAIERVAIQRNVRPALLEVACLIPLDGDDDAPDEV